MFALADADTVRLLRALSLAGPTAALALADRLQLRLDVVRDLLDRAMRLGVVRRSGCASYEVDPAAVATAVHRHRDSLLGAAA